MAVGQRADAVRHRRQRRPRRRLADRVRRLGRPRAPVRIAHPLLPEGGDAVFRSDWTPDATTAVVLGEHGAAMELGRDRDGLGQDRVGRARAARHRELPAPRVRRAAPARSRLPDLRGSWPRGQGHRPQPDPRRRPRSARIRSIASVVWDSDLAGPPPVDGQATITDTRDTPFLDTARVTTAYATAKVDRRFFFVDDRYIVAADTLQRRAGPDPDILVAPARQRRRDERRHLRRPPAAGGEWVQGGGPPRRGRRDRCRPGLVVDPRVEPRGSRARSC